MNGPPPDGSAELRSLAEKLDHVLGQLESARSFAKVTRQQPVIDIARRLVTRDGGIEVLYDFAPRFDAAGLFAGTDWDLPSTLLPNLVSHTLDHGERDSIVLELLSELRLLAVATGIAFHPGLSAEQARLKLTQILALNISRLFGPRGEFDRVQSDRTQQAIERLFRFLLDHIGFEDILGSLIGEVQRILVQRPIQMDAVRGMVTQISMTLADGEHRVSEARLGADRLTSALFGPTSACADDPGLAVYRDRVSAMDKTALRQEARTLARAMHDTGLVSDYHVEFLRWLAGEQRREVLPDALGLSATGTDCVQCYPDLVVALILEAIHPESVQAVYGLSQLLERGLLYSPPIAPSLWRQIRLTPSHLTDELMALRFGTGRPGREHLLAGVISLLGQPLGVGQGNNPTCQSARALSMWALNDPDYLLHLVAHAARHDTIEMHFEGDPIRSANLPPSQLPPRDTDAVSTLLVPHLDRIYSEIGRRCEDRGEDPHRWINPEFHGWWVGRSFAIAVDVATGALKDFEGFVRHFFESYHPYYNGNQPVIHPQPAGLAVTDSTAAFVGWHAITLLRVALDQENTMRVYFYNPNNDSGQDWGHGVHVSIQGNGERHGEASLAFSELASRLYIFHDDTESVARGRAVPDGEIESVVEMARASWAAERISPVPTSSEPQA